MLTYVGSNGSNVVFEDCTFNSIDGDYNLWTYCNVKYQFKKCTFNNTTKGKFFNVYTEGSYNDGISIQIEGCTFYGNAEGVKPVLCVKLYNNTNWNIVWNNNIINNGTSTEKIESEFKTTSDKGYGVYNNIFGVTKVNDNKSDDDKTNYSSTKITIDGTVRFENLEVKN